MFRYVAISAAVICAASTPFILFPRQTPAWGTPGQLIAALLVWPVILISLFLSLYSILHISKWKHSSYYIAVLVPALIFPSTLGATTVIRKIGQQIHLAEQAPQQVVHIRKDVKSFDHRLRYALPRSNIIPIQ